MVEQTKLIDLIEKWEKADVRNYKINIRYLCRLHGITYNEIMKELGVKHETAKSYYNVSHKSRIEFLTALKLARLLDVDVETFLMDYNELVKIYPLNLKNKIVNK